jgi:hypothetical protein
MLGSTSGTGRTGRVRVRVRVAGRRTVGAEGPVRFDGSVPR